MYYVRHGQVPHLVRFLVREIAGLAELKRDR